MSVIWEQQMEKEMEERYSEWKRTVDADEPDWTFVPVDKSWQTYERDYGKQEPRLAAKFAFGGLLLILLICGVNYVSKVVAR